jgi:hypothetical protein
LVTLFLADALHWPLHSSLSSFILAEPLLFQLEMTENDMLKIENRKHMICQKLKITKTTKVS